MPDKVHEIKIMTNTSTKNNYQCQEHKKSYFCVKVLLFAVWNTYGEFDTLEQAVELCKQLKTQYQTVDIFQYCYDN